jgi:hypothetical protein
VAHPRSVADFPLDSLVTILERRNLPIRCKCTSYT